MSAPAWLRLIGAEKEAKAIESCAPIINAKTAKAAQGALDEGYRVASVARSAAWSAARSAARSAAWSAAGSAAWSAAGSAAWSAAWSAAGSAAWSAARSAAEAKLRPTVEFLQASALELVNRMIAVTGEAAT